MVLSVLCFIRYGLHIMRKRESSDLFAFPVHKEYVHSRDAKLVTFYIIDN